jgi:hypothetical protein
MSYGFWAWDEPNSSHSFVECTTDFQFTTYFCINFPQRLIDRIRHSARSTPNLFEKAFFIDVVVTDEVLRCCRRAIDSRNSGLICIVSSPDLVFVP